MRRGHVHAPPAPDDPHQHRSKRAFQPSITSFFAYEQQDSSDSDEDLRGSGPITRQQQHLAKRQQQQRDSVVPSVPGSVQADLLSVGMRVRKSVPEGYKTHKTVSLPSIQTTLAISPNSRASTTSTMTTTDYGVKPPREAVPGELQHQRELLPFCGLQKIGGYAEQPVTNVHLYGGTSASGERAPNLFPLPAEAFTQPFPSQSSTDSAVSNSSVRPNPTNPYKRSWQDEDETPMKLNTEFHFKIPVNVSEDDVPVSPLSESPPTHLSSAFPQAALRPFAQPKTRKGRVMDVEGMIVKEGDIDMDVENAEQGRVLVGSASDFGEADFLMGGV
ncbi:hypothetical protein K458DRAFT_304191 [Lentithecium fluviatile CBS 122367]|uniref:Uncharacterized protein n=1 Tax=Lentithecium fluviatile CBS 122367 TaxID=1168545 RepID=A0A6G1IZH1_9PLEO|nr:hypothetical protein K458DRAFT_304191 [Lentithecium fluviatile CBS 122367]